MATGCEPKAVAEIIRELEAHIDEGVANGQSEERLIADLGAADEIAVGILQNFPATGGSGSKTVMAEQREVRCFLPDELVRQIQQSKNPIVSSYEGVVVHSDKLSKAMINELALQYINTIADFEEIIYLLAYLTEETLETLCTHHTEKIDSNTNLNIFIGKIKAETLSKLLDYQKKHNE